MFSKVLKKFFLKYAWFCSVCSRKQTIPNDVLFGELVEMKIVYTDYDVAIVYSCMLVSEEEDTKY